MRRFLAFLASLIIALPAIAISNAMHFYASPNAKFLSYRHAATIRRERCLFSHFIASKMRVNLSGLKFPLLSFHDDYFYRLLSLNIFDLHTSMR